jgi:sulfite reductase (ferredoxin)
VQLGGRVGEGLTRFGTNIGALPARNVPAFVGRLLADWQSSGHAGDFHAYIDDGGRARAAEFLAQCQQQPLSGRDADLFVDWDARQPFSLAGRGAGECSAGVFDLIEVDLVNARESLEAGRVHAAAVSTVRALLVTRNLQPGSDRQAFELFGKHFIAEGLIESRFGEVVRLGAAAAGAADPVRAFSGTDADVTALLASVRLLYENMDASLRFKAPPK